MVTVDGVFFNLTAKQRSWISRLALGAILKKYIGETFADFFNPLIPLALKAN